MKVDNCRSCGAPIIWVETRPKGTKPPKRMPVDADPIDMERPTATGGFFLREGEDSLIERGRRVIGAHYTKIAALTREADLHTSHYATCPDRDSWRR